MITTPTPTTSPRPRRLSVRLASLTVLIIALALGLVTAVLGVMVLVPGSGLLNTGAALLIPTLALPFSLIGIAVLLIGIVAVRRGLRRSGGATAVLGGLAATSNIVAAGIIIAAIVGAGGSVNVFAATFGLSALGAASPEREEVYTTDSSGNDLTVSIYEPQDGSGPAPTIMYVHGGGWTVGDPNENSTELRTLADQGYLVLSVQYELATPDNATWDKSPAQIACAASWIQSNADTLGANTDQLAFWGESAGGHLITYTASTAADGRAVSSCGGTVPVPAAIVADYPGVDVARLYEDKVNFIGNDIRTFASNFTGGSPEQFPERYEAVDLATHLNPDIPPALLMVPARDQVVRPSDEYAWAQAAQELGVDVKVVTIPLANHGYTMGLKNSLAGQGHLSIGERFLAEQLR